MAFADVMLGAVSLPLYIYLRIGFRSPLWRIGVLDPLEVFFLWIDLIFLQASLISAVFISCERFYAVYWPLKHQTLAFIVSAFFKLVRDFLPTKTYSCLSYVNINFDFFARLMLLQYWYLVEVSTEKQCANECYSSAKQSAPSPTPYKDLAGQGRQRRTRYGY